MSKLDEQLHKILSHYIGNYVTADEYESDVKEAGQAIQALIAQQVKEATINGLIMAKYGTDEDSKEERFIDNLIMQESK